MSKAPADWSGAVAGLPSYVRFARYAHAVLVSAFLTCVVVQVFFAGVGIFGAAGASTSISCLSSG